MGFVSRVLQVAYWSYEPTVPGAGAVTMARRAGSKHTSTMLDKLEPKGKAAVLVLVMQLSIFKSVFCQNTLTDTLSRQIQTKKKKKTKKKRAYKIFEMGLKQKAPPPTRS